jgi:hypothetical protein
LADEHRRGHGSLYAASNRRRVLKRRRGEPAQPQRLLDDRQISGPRAVTPTGEFVTAPAKGRQRIRKRRAHGRVGPCVVAAGAGPCQ